MAKLNDVWTQDGATRIEVRGTPGIGGKFFGIPWMAFGLYFIYQWVFVTMLEYIRTGDYSGLISGLLVWLLMFAGLFVIFIVPGWALAFTRRRVIVDHSRGEVEEGNDFVVYRRLKTHSLSEFKQVRLVETISKSKNSRGNTKRVIFQDVRLIRDRLKDFVLVGTMGSLPFKSS
ncbi:MAG: hypothetical protein MUO77_21555 [Anaerolineales bacterium]|nr:hypothetical protein [Anaerolineales bacterium]